MPGSEGHYNLISATIGSEAPRTPSQTSESPTNGILLYSCRSDLSMHTDYSIQKTISPVSVLD